MLQSIEQATSIILGVIFFILILIAAYFSAKFIGKRYGCKVVSGKNIKVLEKMALSQDKMLMIVKVADKTMLLGVTGNHIDEICELDEEKLEFKEDKSHQDGDFASLLKKMAKDKFDDGFFANKNSKKGKDE